MGKTVLVVEDNELNLRLFCDLLNAHGYSAHPVRDGRDALAKAREIAPDLIIMDIQLPHVSGLELIGQMKADLTLRAVPIIVPPFWMMPLTSSHARRLIRSPPSIRSIIAATMRLWLDRPRSRRPSIRVPSSAGSAVTFPSMLLRWRSLRRASMAVSNHLARLRI